jgi:hypothetical protein
MGHRIVVWDLLRFWGEKRWDLHYKRLCPFENHEVVCPKGSQFNFGPSKQTCEWRDWKMVQLKVLFQVLPMVVQCWNMKHCTIYIVTLHYGPHWTSSISFKQQENLGLLGWKLPKFRSYVVHDLKRHLLMLHNLWKLSANISSRPPFVSIICIFFKGLQISHFLVVCDFCFLICKGGWFLDLRGSTSSICKSSCPFLIALWGDYIWNFIS